MEVKNNKILIIDDQKSNLSYMRDILIKSIPSCKIFTAQSGIEGIEIAKNENPDTILLDVVMPKMDGYEVCKQLKSDKITNTTPIILISLFKKDTNSRVLGLKSGADVFLSKPFEPAELTALVQSMIRIKTAEEKLRDNNKKYHIIANFTYDWEYWVDTQGNYIYVSPSCKRITGYSPNEFIENSKLLDTIIHPDDFKLLKNHKHKILSDLEINQIDFRIIKKNGEIRWIGHVCIPVYDKQGNYNGTRGSNRDITKHKNISAENKMLSIAVEQSANTIVITDINGNIQYTNPKFTDLTGYTEKEAFGQNPRILSANTQPKEYYYSMWKTISSGEMWKGEFHNKAKNGNMFWENVTITPIKDDDGNITKYLAIKEDITIKKQNEENLKNHAKQLQIRNEELDAFSHTVAHDLKNPIGTMMGFASIINDDAPKYTHDELKQFTSIIIRNGEKTQQIIDSLLLFASVREKDIVTKKLNMSNIINEVMVRLTQMIEQNDAKITFSKNWPSTMGYAPWVEEVWVNYLSNALKYGGNSPSIEFGYDDNTNENQKEKMIRFWIRDNGPGISQEDQKIVFDKFERLNKPNLEGNGLGLSIVKRIIEKLGGEAGVESKIGNGSLFYFTLPTI